MYGYRADILLRPALDGDDAEFGVLVADLAVLLVLLRGMPSLGLLDALPLLDGDAFRRRAFERGAVARGKQLATFLLDQRLRLRRILLHVRVVVADVDLGDGVDRRLPLRVQRVNAKGSDPEACDDSQRDAGTSLHGFSFAMLRFGRTRPPPREQPIRRVTFVHPSPASARVIQTFPRDLQTL